MNLLVVCSDGYCLLSCGDSKDDRSEDLQNLLSQKPCDNKASSDLQFCEKNVNCTKTPDVNFQAENGLMRYGTYVSSILFLVLGCIFTVISGIFSFVNVCHTPIELIYGAHGLILWNAIASLSYFLVICIFGGEFGQRLSNGAPISDLARPKAQEYLWQSDSEKLGYSYA